MSISEMLRARENIKNAQREEPLLGGCEGNARRRAVLGHVRAELASRGGAAHAHAADLAGRMMPNSVAEAWDGLRLELARLGEGALAEAVARECQQARGEAWQSMSSDGDIISQVVPMGEQFTSSHAASVNAYRQKVSAMAECARPFRLGADMEDHVVNMARFGSMADDWMTRVLIDELYLERGMYEAVIGICRRIAGFEGCDRQRMMASTLVEDVLNSLLGHLGRCESPGHVDDMAKRGMPISPECGDRGYLDGLKEDCLGLLVGRARDLGLGIEPDHGERSLLRRATDYALKVRARQTTHGAGEIVAYVRDNYPASHEFLGLGGARAAARMANARTPLVESVSVQIELGRIARIRNTEAPTDGALDALEPMLGLIKGKGIGIKAKTLSRWRDGMLGGQMWESLFEMEVCLRLAEVGASVEADVEIPKAGGGRAEVDLEADGCLVEAYSPRDAEIRELARATHAKSPGMAMVDYVTGKPQMRHVGERQAAVVVNCPAGEFADIEAVKPRMEERLAATTQPGAVFYVKDGSDPAVATCLVNGNAAAAIPDKTIRTIMDALSLRPPQAWGRGMRRPAGR